MTLFLDTNVLIDFILQREAYYEQVAFIMACAQRKKITIVVSSLTIVNARYLCVERQKQPLEQFNKKYDFLVTFMQVCSVDSSDTTNSYDAKWKDFEDGVQYFAAKRHGFDYIVTRNKKDFECDKSKLLSPEEACYMLESLVASQTGQAQ